MRSHLLFFPLFALASALPETKQQQGFDTASKKGQEPQGHEFVPAKPDDSRSPCPWLNALANHNYIPHDGRHIQPAQVAHAFEETLGFAPGTLDGPLAAAVTTGTRGDGTFDLADTVKHDVIEHDASLSRNDAAVGDALHFDPAVWNRTKSHFAGRRTISLECAAAARLDRIATARELNPRFELTEGGLSGTFMNSALYLMTFGDKVEGDANTLYTSVMFEEERFPWKEGFVKANSPITGDDISNMIAKFQRVNSKVGNAKAPREYGCTKCK